MCTALLSWGDRAVSCHSLHALQVNPFEPETHWYTNDKQLMPLSARPEPKRRFRPSQWEEKK